MTVLYGSNVADTTITTACKLTPNLGGTETSVATAMSGVNNNYGEVQSQGGTITPVTAIPSTPTGHGWVYAPGAGTFASGNWSASISLQQPDSGVNVTYTVRFFRYSGGSYTLLGSSTVSTTSPARVTYAFPATSLAAATFATSDLLYVDLWQFDNTGVNGNTDTVWVSTSATAGVANDMQVTTSTFTAGGGGGPAPSSTLALMEVG